LRGDADEFSDVDVLVVMETERNVKDLGDEMVVRGRTECLLPGQSGFHREAKIPGFAREDVRVGQ
jgi:predicted nucleotidyltransferase